MGVFNWLGMGSFRLKLPCIRPQEAVFLREFAGFYQSPRSKSLIMKYLA
jgi:hypothetical protein